jgi:hypothetical protein
MIWGRIFTESTVWTDLPDNLVGHDIDIGFRAIFAVLVGVKLSAIVLAGPTVLSEAQRYAAPSVLGGSIDESNSWAARLATISRA